MINNVNTLNGIVMKNQKFNIKNIVFNSKTSKTISKFLAKNI